MLCKPLNPPYNRTAHTPPPSGTSSDGLSQRMSPLASLTKSVVVAPDIRNPTSNWSVHTSEFPMMRITIHLLALTSFGRVKSLCFESQMELPMIVYAEYYERSFDAGNRAPNICSSTKFSI